MSSDEDLLQILQQHGQQFLSSFSLPVASSSQKRKRANSPPRVQKLPKVQTDEIDDSYDSDEWTGIVATVSNSEESSEEGKCTGSRV
jgi:hypothetical protein